MVTVRVPFYRMNYASYVYSNNLRKTNRFFNPIIVQFFQTYFFWAAGGSSSRLSRWAAGWVETARTVTENGRIG